MLQDKNLLRPAAQPCERLSLANASGYPLKKNENTQTRCLLPIQHWKESGGECPIAPQIFLPLQHRNSRRVSSFFCIFVINSPMVFIHWRYRCSFAWCSQSVSQKGDETVPDRIKVFLKTQVPIIYFHVAKLYTLSIMTNTCIVIHKWPSTAMSILEHNFQHQYGLDDVSDRQTSYIVHWYWQQCQISSDLQGCPKVSEGKEGFPLNH